MNANTRVINCPRCKFRHQYGKCKAMSCVSFKRALSKQFIYSKCKDTYSQHKSPQHALRPTPTQELVNQLDIDDMLGLTADWDLPTDQLQSDLDLKIENYTVTFRLDTGAIDNISLQLAQIIGLDKMVNPASSNIMFLNGSILPVIGDV